MSIHACFHLSLCPLLNYHYCLETLMTLLPLLLCFVSAEEAMQTATLEALEMRRGGADRDNVIGCVWKEKREIWLEKMMQTQAQRGGDQVSHFLSRSRGGTGVTWLACIPIQSQISDLASPWLVTGNEPVWWLVIPSFFLIWTLLSTANKNFARCWSGAEVRPEAMFGLGNGAADN